MTVYPPLRLSSPSKADAVVVDTPVILAPMAGITNRAYRQLCAEQGAGLYVCEMLTSRGIVIQDRKTQKMLGFAPNEQIRSVQTYGVDPEMVARATHVLCDQYGVNHVDLNFGCPVPKVTRKGGGGALPWKQERFRAILRAVVKAADTYGVPVTMKTRKGIDEAHLYYLDAGRIAEQEGVAAICLHARTVGEAYSGQADWDSIARLVEHVSIPVLGNGDIWEASDALRMVEQTGCAAVEVGRGCLGRPWLFRDLADAFAGRETQHKPTLGEVAAMVRRHGELLAEVMGEQYGLTDLRKHMAWYFKGFPVGGELRHQLAMISDFETFDALLAQLDHDAPFPELELGKPRGRQGTPRAKVILPYGWYDDTDGRELELSDDEAAGSGG
ncbi:MULTISPECIES: tRNA dihydrouridine synthase DusB [unclassified Luteococcus]|uniref:tRNA dihydrouridine synthase DusB n=1 Tax=unclassified Luteococcus TaxID=2639923 RepID=UPI00313D9079